MCHEWTYCCDCQLHEVVQYYPCEIMEDGEECGRITSFHLLHLDGTRTCPVCLPQQQHPAINHQRVHVADANAAVRDNANFDVMNQFLDIRARWIHEDGTIYEDTLRNERLFARIAEELIPPTRPEEQQRNMTSAVQGAANQPQRPASSNDQQQNTVSNDQGVANQPPSSTPPSEQQQKRDTISNVQGAANQPQLPAPQDKQQKNAGSDNQGASNKTQRPASSNEQPKNPVSIDQGTADQPRSSAPPTEQQINTAPDNQAAPQKPQPPASSDEQQRSAISDGQGTANTPQHPASPNEQQRNAVSGNRGTVNQPRQSTARSGYTVVRSGDGYSIHRSRWIHQGNSTIGNESNAAKSRPDQKQSAAVDKHHKEQRNTDPHNGTHDSNDQAQRKNANPSGKQNGTDGNKPNGNNQAQSKNVSTPEHQSRNNGDGENSSQNKNSTEEPLRRKHKGSQTNSKAMERKQKYIRRLGRMW